MRLSHGTGSQLDFRKKKKSSSRWAFRLGLLAVFAVLLLVRFAPVIEEIRSDGTAATAPAPEAPRVIQMN